jgi:hypothetical protein
MLGAKNTKKIPRKTKNLPRPGDTGDEVRSSRKPGSLSMNCPL